MTMFRELYALAMTATLTMIVSADEKTGKLTISVLPKPRKDVGEPALTKDLTLTASPEDFDAGFVEALRGYREVRDSLTEQAEATREVLEAAKSVSAKKATEAMTKASKSATAAQPAPSPTAVDATGDEDEHGAADGAVDRQAATPAPGESLALFG
ncbi:MAG: PRTRC system protein E [Sulfuriferula sp.]